jgi:alpha-ketoglutarate-dependent taurine dioxygenase
MASAHIDVRPLSGALGAEVLGADLGQPDEATVESIRRIFVDYGVICIRDQRLTPEGLVAFARRFGTLDVHPIVNGTEEIPELVRVWKPAGASASFGVGWHSDNSFFETPSRASVLYGITIPPYGGDTLFASMESAYAALSEPMQRFLDGMTAVHSAARAYDPRVTGEAKYRGDAPITYRFSDAISQEVEHPVIRTHPDTGRKSIYVNQMFTQRILGLRERESAALLGFLYDHCTQPDFTCRLRWSPGSVAMWDNRRVQHYALDDYRPFERLMLRVTIRGERPV